MTLIFAILLGMVQGLTEFLPVSSSGHLALFQNLNNNINVGFDVVVHLATLLAILAFFYEDIFVILRDVFLLRTSSENFKFGIYIVIASIPAAVVGFLIRYVAEDAFSSLMLVGVGFVVSGFFLFIASFFSRAEELSFSSVSLIGLSQALAILPGISRSGATISSGIMAGLDKNKAMKFSFLLAIPAILGASILEFGKISNLSYGVFMAGFASAFVFGLLGMFVFTRYVSIENFRYFAFYCWLLALVIFFMKSFAML